VVCFLDGNLIAEYPQLTRARFADSSWSLPVDCNSSRYLHDGGQRLTGTINRALASQVMSAVADALARTTHCDLTGAFSQNRLVNARTRLSSSHRTKCFWCRGESEEMLPPVQDLVRRAIPKSGGEPLGPPALSSLKKCSIRSLGTRTQRRANVVRRWLVGSPIRATRSRRCDGQSFVAFGTSGARGCQHADATSVSAASDAHSELWMAAMHCRGQGWSLFKSLHACLTARLPGTIAAR